MTVRLCYRVSAIASVLALLRNLCLLLPEACRLRHQVSTFPSTVSARGRQVHRRRPSSPHHHCVSELHSLFIFFRGAGLQRHPQTKTLPTARGCKQISVPPMKLRSPWVQIQVSTPPPPGNLIPANMVAMAEPHLSCLENAPAVGSVGPRHKTKATASHVAPFLLLCTSNVASFLPSSLLSPPSHGRPRLFCSVYTPSHREQHTPVP